VHACRIAQALGAPALLFPLGAGVLSSFGFLSAPLAFDFVRSWRARLDDMDFSRASALLREMEAHGERLLTQSSVDPAQITHRRLADMRYVGQGHEIRVELPADDLSAAHAPAIADAFRNTYQRLYERLGPPVAVEVLNWRVVSSGPDPRLSLRFEGDASTDAALAVRAHRAAWFPELGGFTPTPVYDRYRLAPGAAFSGPAIVEERESTVVVPPGAHCEIDAQWNLRVTLP
jgi:N-methylhydantoinase A